jgi:putative spermidine/putrescine transport system substrate-binding protein
MNDALNELTTRRNAILGGAAAAAVVILSQRAAAAVHLVGIDWGGPTIGATKQITARDKNVDISWDLHAGGAGTVLPKIKAAWPHPKYDFVAAWNPVFVTMTNEDWLEPLSFEDIPNLRDVPAPYLFKNATGAIVNVPRSLAGMFWAYRIDSSPVKIDHVEQLFDPKLKGQICWPGPNINSNLQLLSLALSAGGNEKNMEPGWQLLKKLARSGNIGRVAATETDFINSITIGETSVGFWNIAAWREIAKHFPLKVLTRISDDKALKAFMYQDGWVVLKSSPNKKAVKDYLNFFIDPQNNLLFNQIVGQVPTNQKVHASGFGQNISFSAEEIGQYAYFPDFTILAGQLDGSVKRFETEILPLL